MMDYYLIFVSITLLGALLFFWWLDVMWCRHHKPKLKPSPLNLVRADTVRIFGHKPPIYVTIIDRQNNSVYHDDKYNDEELFFSFPSNRPLVIWTRDANREGWNFYIDQHGNVKDGRQA